MKRVFCLALAALFCLCTSAQELSNFNFGGRRQIVSPEITENSVTFRLAADYATQVSLSGTWMSGLGSSIPMKKGEGGVWSVTIDKPEAEIYTYNFVVDGVSVNDPQNFFVQRDGTRFLNMLIVPGERSANYNETSHRGTVSYRWYDSAILGINRRLTVYTPYGYEDAANRNRKYPVLYLLHGAGGDEEAWSSMGRAAQILDNLIEQGKAEPMIVVMPNGNPNQQAACTMGLPEKELPAEGLLGDNGFVKSLVGEIVPFIEKNYRVLAKPASRAVAGLSMGGGHTIAAARMAPAMFGYVCPLSAAVFGDMEEARQDFKSLKDAGCKLFWIGCGSSDFLFDSSNGLDKALTEIGFNHTYYVSEGGHEWKNWRLYLNTFAPLLFKAEGVR